MSRNSKIGIAAIVVIAIVAVGVGAAYYTAYVPPSSTTSPSVSITSPASGDIVSGPTVTVTVSSTNLPSGGTYWVYLDGAYQAGSGTVFTFSNVAPGTHTIWAQLYNSDGSPVSPAAVTPLESITVASPSIQPSQSAVSIVSPTDGTTVTGPSVSVMVSSPGFNVPADGYYYVYMDSPSNFQIATGSTVTFSNVSPGTHTIWVQLYNLDGTPVNPQSVSPAVTVSVASPPSTQATISILSPANGDLATDRINVLVSSTNFAVPGQGYYGVSIDGAMSGPFYMTGTSSVFAFKGISPGVHTVTAWLLNPDGTPLSPTASTSIYVTSVTL